MQRVFPASLEQFIWHRSFYGYDVLFDLCRHSLECISQPGLYLPGEKSSNEAQKLFRNINSETIIPSSVYDENKDEILHIEKSLMEKSLSQEEKTKMREKLKMFTLSVEEYRLVRAKTIYVIKPGRYDEIQVIDSEYDSNHGLMKIVQRDGEVISNMI